MYRADHYEAADRLVAKVLRQLDGGDWRDEDLPSMALQVATAQVHATLAAAPREVEAEVKANERAVSAAVVSAEDIRVRLLGETFTREDDCEETDHDTRGDCDGPVKRFEQLGTSYGKPQGSTLLLCQSHARSAVRFIRVRVRR